MGSFFIVQLCMRDNRIPSLLLLAILFAAGLGGLWTTTASAMSVDMPAAPGSLVRGQTFSAVYYVGKDGFRYVFPSEKTYFTWYTDFSAVQWLSDADLAKIQIGGNVTYKPGAKMVKIDSDPKTYAVDHGGEIRHIATEAIALSLYGSAWNTMVDDVPDGFFTNYSVGSPITSKTDYSVTGADDASATIHEDKDLVTVETVGLTDAGILGTDGSPDVTIPEGGTVLWYNVSSTSKHSATAEDGSWGTGTILPGEWFVKRFEEAGDYDYFDTYFEDNTATVTVE